MAVTKQGARTSWAPGRAAPSRKSVLAVVFSFLLALLALPVAPDRASAQTTTTIDFENLPAGQEIKTQYAPAVDFTAGPSATPGLRPLVVAVPPGVAQSGNHVASISNCPGGFGCEFFEPDVTAVFGTLHSRVSPGFSPQTCA
jgi:hypothetical protein